MDNNRSVEVLGVRILVNDVDSAVRTALFVARYKFSATVTRTR